MAPLLARAPSAERQFERIYRRHVADVYRYALVVLRNPQDAEDVTQTTFMNAYRAMQNGERPETPKNWLIAIAHNVCRQRFRQQMRRPLEVGLFEDGAEAAVFESEERYSVEDIQRALGHLAFNQRSALVMRELEGRSYVEIGEIMGLSVSAVETLIFRARRALREQLEGTLTCVDAEFFLSKQLDGQLARSERGQLRAHLRECKECATLARKQRASRGALKAMLGVLPVPTSVTSLFGGGSAAGVGLAAKAAAVVCAGAVVGTGGYEAAKKIDPARHASAVAAATSSRSGGAKTNVQGELNTDVRHRVAAARKAAAEKKNVFVKLATHAQAPKTHPKNPVAAAVISTKLPKLVPPGRAKPKHIPPTNTPPRKGNSGAPRRTTPSAGNAELKSLPDVPRTTPAHPQAEKPVAHTHTPTPVRRHASVSKRHSPHALVPQTDTVSTSTVSEGTVSTGTVSTSTVSTDAVSTVTTPDGVVAKRRGGGR